MGGLGIPKLESCRMQHRPNGQPGKQGTDVPFPVQKRHQVDTEHAISTDGFWGCQLRRFLPASRAQHRYVQRQKPPAAKTFAREYSRIDLE
jgi:hypothetical protein